MIKRVPTDLTFWAASNLMKRTRPAPSIALKVVTDVSSQPIADAKSVAGVVAPIKTDRATPQVAPAVTPRIEESVTGFLNNVCICSPANPNAPPTKTAVIVRGIRICQTMVFQASLVLSCENKILSI